MCVGMFADTKMDMCVDKNGNKVPMSVAEHYCLRDMRLRHLNAQEFTRAFEIRCAKDKKADAEWLKKVINENLHCSADADAPETTKNGPGRPCDRYRLLPPHPLSETHILVKKERYGMTALAGAAVPKLPVKASKKEKQAWSMWMLANFVPWHLKDEQRLGESNSAVSGVTYEDWEMYYKSLKADARVGKEVIRGSDGLEVAKDYEREPDGDKDGWDKRRIGASRLMLVENLIGAFDVKQETNDLVSANRFRSHHFWDDKTRPKDDATHGFCAQTKKVIDDMNRKKQKKADQADVPTRLNRANEVADVVEKLRHPLKMLRGSNKIIPGPELAEMWACAANPDRRTATGLDGHAGPVDVKEIGSKNATTLTAHMEQQASAKHSESAAGSSSGTSDGHLAVPAVYADLSEAAYTAEASAWMERRKNKDPSAPKHGPLNVQQRSAGRNVYGAAKLRAHGRQQNLTAGETVSMMKRQSVPLITEMVGQGGSGKSAVVHSLSAEMKKCGLGVLVVTAFTGVACAPFGGPTMCSLLEMGHRKKGAKPSKAANRANADKAADMRVRFRQQSGVDIKDVGALVVDEVSFIGDKLIGELDARLRVLLGEPDVLMGGLPVLLCGDNHQLCGPGTTPWYKSMVKEAAGEDIGSGADPKSASAKGLLALSQACVVWLTRNMRAGGDEAFGGDKGMLQAMRNTASAHPVPDALVDGMQVLSSADVKRDQTWAFSPIGVLAKIERDTLNYAQLKAFAKAFDLPMVYWRRKMCDPGDISHLTEDEQRRLFENEPNLMGWFVEGAPVVLTENISPTRKLVNGSAGVLDSLTFAGGVVPDELKAAYARRGYCKVELHAVPLSVNVRVGGTEKDPVWWHGIKLDDLSAHVSSAVPNAQVVPLFAEFQMREEKAAQIRSTFAAQHMTCSELELHYHPYMLAFAMTGAA